MKIEDLPRPANYRRQMAKNGGYEMVPAYTAEEVLGILEGVNRDSERYRWLFGARTEAECEDENVGFNPPLPQDLVIADLAGFYAHKKYVDDVIDAAIKKGQV